MAADRLLLSDGTSRLLLSDGVSFLLLSTSSGDVADPYPQTISFGERTTVTYQNPPVTVGFREPKTITYQED